MEDEKLVRRQAAVKIAAARSSLLAQYPFFGRLLLRMPIGISDCPTAQTDMETIQFGLEFLSRLSTEETEAVLLHELLHCVLKHCLRTRGKLPFLYNLACDLVVNSMILAMMKRTELEIDGEPMMHRVPDGSEGRLYTAEQVYAMLVEKANRQQEEAGLGIEEKTASDPGQNSKTGSRKKGNGKQTTDGRTKKHPNPADQKEAEGQNGFQDSHELWKAIKAVQTEQDWNDRIRQAAQSQNLPGSLPLAIRREVQSIYKEPETDWRLLLQSLIRHLEADYTFSRPDPRYEDPFILPSWMNEQTGSQVENIWICVDTSGSISEEQLAEAMEEIYAAFSQIDSVKGWISWFDAAISEPAAFDSLESIQEIPLRGYGGTSFRQIFEKMPEFFPYELPKMIIILTDGFADFPETEAAQGTEVVWMIVESDVKVPWGEQVTIGCNQDEDW